MSNTQFDRSIDNERLPIGLTQETAERVRALAAELRAAGLNVLFSVSDDVERHMSIIAGDAMSLLPITQDLGDRMMREILAQSAEFRRNEA